MRTITEKRTFTSEEIENLAKSAAKMEIIGDIYKGEFISQEIEYSNEGIISVITKHTPAT